MNVNYESMEKKCCCESTEPMSFADTSMATFKALMETDDILDSIAVLLSGECHSEPKGGSPDCLSGNVEANLYWANQVRARIRSLATALGVKEFK